MQNLRPSGPLTSFYEIDKPMIHNLFTWGQRYGISKNTYSSFDSTEHITLTVHGWNLKIVKLLQRWYALLTGDQSVRNMCSYCFSHLSNKKNIVKRERYSANQCFIFIFETIYLVSNGLWKGHFGKTQEVFYIPFAKYRPGQILISLLDICKSFMDT